MQEQALLAVDDADALFAEQPELARLRWALAHASGFGLYFARCNVPVYRDRLARALEAKLERPVVDVHLRSDGDALDAQLTEALRGVPSEAVAFVYNLENLLPTTDASLQHRTLQELNWRRGAFGRLERPLVFWLPEFALTILARGAPDFFDWYSGLYEFDVPKPMRAALLIESLKPLGDLAWMAIGLSAEEKHRWERVVRSLMAEGDALEGVDASIKATLLLYLSMLQASRGEMRAASQLAEQALTIFEEQGFAAGMGSALHILGIQHSLQGVPERARQYLEQAAVTHEALGERTRFANVLDNLGSLEMAQGDFPRAQEDYARALTMRTELDDRAGMVASLSRLGRAHELQGDYRSAREYYERALAIAQELADRAEAAASLSWLGRLDLLEGNYEQARKRFEQAMILREELGDQSGITETLRDLGVLAARNGDFGQARARLEKSLTLDRQLDNGIGVAATLYQLGLLSRLEGRTQEAAVFLAQAFLLLERLGIGLRLEVYRDLINLREEMGVEAFATALKGALPDAQRVIKELQAASEQVTAPSV